MSLTSMLKGNTEKDKQFQNIIKSIISPRPEFTTVSGKKAFSDEYDYLVPYTLSKQNYSSLVGIGFDYLARFIVGNDLKIKNNSRLRGTYMGIAQGACRELMACHGLYNLKTDPKLYETLEKKYYNGLELCDYFIILGSKGKKDFDKLINFAGYLASLEVVARSGRPPEDINILIEDTNIEIIDDLRSLCKVFKNKFIKSGIIKEGSDVVFNPHFGSTARYVGGADADIFIDGTLYDFKTVKDRGYDWIECAQLVGYYLLHTIDIRCGGFGLCIAGYGDKVKREVNRLAFYKSRYGEIEYFDVNSLDKDKVEQAIEELRKLWGLKFR